MISRLSGKLEGVEGLAAQVSLASGDIAYQVLVPAFLAERLAGQVGSQVSFTTFEYLESQGQGTSFIPRLVGFQSAVERKFFELFTTVKGIGNRRALRAMTQEPGAIARAIVAKDAKALTRLPEIGKRMAETVIAELHGKVDAFLAEGEAADLDAAAVGRVAGGPIDEVGEEAVEALVALGETRGDAEGMVSRARARAAREGKALGTATDLLEVVFGGRGA